MAPQPSNHGDRSLIEVRDVWTAVQLLIPHYGPHAAARAAERTDELRQAGDVIGITVSQRILGAVEDLQRNRDKGIPPTEAPHWFALGADRPLFAFTGIWRPWTGARGTKAEGARRQDGQREPGAPAVRLRDYRGQ
jgi:hypothetical protein